MSDNKNMQLLHLIDNIVNRLQSGAQTRRTFPFEYSIYRFAEHSRDNIYTLETLFNRIVFVFESPTQCKIKSFDYKTTMTRQNVSVTVTEAIQDKYPITIVHAQEVFKNAFQ